MAPVLDTVHYNLRMSLIYDAWAVRVSTLFSKAAIQTIKYAKFFVYFEPSFPFLAFCLLEIQTERVFTRCEAILLEFLAILPCQTLLSLPKTKMMEMRLC